MKKVISVLLCITLFSCSKKEIQLPQLGETVSSEIKDHSPVYLFFEIEGNDTLVVVNRNNTISSTNWLFHVDKRLPLKLVIPEIKNLQTKKDKSAHKNKLSENYFTYMDKSKKTLAFLPFTNVQFLLNTPDSVLNTIYFRYDGSILFNNQILDEQELAVYLNQLRIEKETEIFIGYDDDLSFESYLYYRLIARKIIITRIGLSVNYDKEFIY